VKPYIFNDRFLGTFKFENTFSLEFLTLQNYYNEQKLEIFGSLKKFNSGVKHFYNCFKNLNNLKIPESGRYNGKIGVRFNSAFELSSSN
jgi:hypothetical protein